MEKYLNELIHRIRPMNQDAQIRCEARLDSIAKPLKSLGKGEAALIKIAGIHETANITIEKKALIIMCADNGVVAEKISQTGQEITAIVAENFLKQKTCVSVMAECAKVDLYPVDIGIARKTNIIQKKVAFGTKNLRVEPAMTRKQAIQSILVGIEMVEELKNKGYQMIATGEMGIGNTTTSSAIASVLLKEKVSKMTGKGAGLSREGIERKIQVITDSLELHRPNSEDILDVLAKIGGLDIGGLLGVFLGGGIHRVPIVIDGFISSVAALMAFHLNPMVRDFMLPSHASKEPAAQRVLQEIGLTPFLDCEMCLGEGTGAIALFPFLDMLAAIYQKMSTFKEINISAYQPYYENPKQ